MPSKLYLIDGHALAYRTFFALTAAGSTRLTTSSGEPNAGVFAFASVLLKEQDFFVISAHREENVDQPAHLASLVEALNALAKRYRFPLVFSVHPRTRQRLAAGRHKLHRLVRTLPPLGFFDYVALQMRAFCTLSDSGTIAEESSILAFPAVTVREAHERPEGMDEGAVIMSGLSKERILQSVAMTIAQFKKFGPCRIPDDYNVNQVSWKVAKIILGYTDYVNRRVWYKA